MVNTFFLITGLFFLAVSIIHWVWVYLVKKGRIPWNTLKNKLFLVSDGVGGLLLASNSLDLNQLLWKVFIGLIIILLMASHFIRTFQFLSKESNAFCPNQSLFFINNFKLVLLFGALFTVLPL